MVLSALIAHPGLGVHPEGHGAPMVHQEASYRFLEEVCLISLVECFLAVLVVFNPFQTLFCPVHEEGVEGRQYHSWEEEDLLEEEEDCLEDHLGLEEAFGGYLDLVDRLKDPHFDLEGHLDLEDHQQAIRTFQEQRFDPQKPDHLHHSQ